MKSSAQPTSSSVILWKKDCFQWKTLAKLWFNIVDSTRVVQYWHAEKNVSAKDP